MKILNVRFRNINTLRGEWEIHFDRSPLKEAGLFAITGPNGSGKSTILDAISLALYARTPRLDQPAKHVLTRGTSDGFAEVTISVNGVEYRSAWSGFRADGAVETRMKLTDMSRGEKVLSDKVHLVPAEIAELTGLDFKRFTQSIMLAQGEFAAFLDALDNERIEILEQIIGQELYEDRRKQVLDRAAVEMEERRRLTDELGRMAEPSDEEKTAIEHERERRREEMDDALQVVARYESRQDALKKRKAQVHAIEDLEASLASTRTDRERMAPDMARLSKAAELSVLSQDLDRLQQMGKERGRAADGAARAEDRILEITRRIDAMTAQKADAEASLEAAKSAWTSRQGEIDRALVRQQQIAENQKVLDARSGRRTELARELNRINGRPPEIEAALSASLARRKEVTAWLADNDVVKQIGTLITAIDRDLVLLAALQDRQPAVLLRKNAAQEEKNKARTAVNRAQRAVQKAEKQHAHLTKQRADLQETMTRRLGDQSPDAILAAYEENRKKLAALRRMIKTSKAYRRAFKGGETVLDEALARARKSAETVLEEYEADNEILAILQHTIHPKGAPDDPVEEGPCPVCGREPCPLRGDDTLSRDGIDTVLKRHLAKSRRLGGGKRAFGRHIKHLYRRIVLLESMGTTWQQLINDTGTVAEIGDIPAIKQAMAAVRKAGRDHRKEAGSVARMQKRIGNLDRKIAENARILEDHRTKASSLENDVTRQGDETASLDAEAHQLGEREAELRKRISDQLSPFDEAFSPSDSAETLIVRLRKRQEEYRDNGEKVDELLREEERLREEADGLPEALKAIEEDMAVADRETADAKQRQQSLAEEMARDYGPGDPQGEAEALTRQIASAEGSVAKRMTEVDAASQSLAYEDQERKALDEGLARLNRDYDALRHELGEKARAAGFRDVSAIPESVLSAEEQAAIRDAARSLDQKIQQTEEELSGARRELDLIPDGPAPGPDDADQVSGARERIATLTSAQEEANKRLRDVGEAKAAYQAKAAALEVQGEICDELEPERLFYESASPGEIRQRAQVMMLERLVTQSNQHLDALSGRYHLSRRHGEGELKIEVVDLKQGEEHRSLGTLSGGERFLVSLSLALGLADLAGPGREIQTLFIDEGFGRLDDEALYRVLAFLKNLKSSGKMVGVISHIQQLADEIPTKIRLEKTAEGSSRMAIVP